MSTNRAASGVYSSPPPRDAQGNKLCRNCRGPMPKRRRHNCSPECSEAWVCKTSPGHMRRRVFERDRGVCAQCGIDTEYFRRQLPKADYKTCAAFAKQYGVPAGRVHTDWWDADHRVPVIEGGGECTLDNMRTLCIPCHKKETAALARRRARDRHVARPLPLFDGLR